MTEPFLYVSRPLTAERRRQALAPRVPRMHRALTVRAKQRTIIRGHSTYLHEHVSSALRAWKEASQGRTFWRNVTMAIARSH